MKLCRFSKSAGAAAAAAALILSGVALAKGPPTGGEGEGNRLSYPVILPENQAPAGFPSPSAWTFATVTEDQEADECTVGAPDDPVPIPEEFPCYWDGAQVWWLGQRAENFWKAFSVAPEIGTGPVVVTFLDAGNLLESSPNLNLRRIRTEFTMYQDASLDPRFSGDIPTFVDSEIAFPFPAGSTCTTPAAGVEVGCFAAFRMSGAVPGTEQSINEIQGTDFGVNTATNTLGHSTASGTLIDPTTVIPDEEFPGEFIPAHATVYSNCARLVIQKLTGGAAPGWDPVNGFWDTSLGLAGDPVVNVATYTDLGNGGMYSAEINAGGKAIYGYNWNASRDSAGPGVYRLTFVLDGRPRCPSLNAEFDDLTEVVNPGEVSSTFIIPRDDPDLNGGTEGGLAYVDVNLAVRGGGGGGGGGGGNPNR